MNGCIIAVSLVQSQKQQWQMIKRTVYQYISQISQNMIPEMEEFLETTDYVARYISSHSTLSFNNSRL